MIYTGVYHTPSPKGVDAWAYRGGVVTGPGVQIDGREGAHTAAASHDVDVFRDQE